MKKFYAFNTIKNEDGLPIERELRLDGVIAEDSWWDDDVSAKEFRQELYAGNGNVAVWINSPGGDVFAGFEIYTMLKEYPGKVTVKVDALAASAASVVAMAGDEVLVSPVSQMMIHNPWVMAMGDTIELMKVKRELDSIKDSIINAYEHKTGLSRSKLSAMMDSEKWMDANEAISLGFADKILYDGAQPAPTKGYVAESPYKIVAAIRKRKAAITPKPQGINPQSLYDRLNLIKPREAK